MNEPVETFEHAGCKVSIYYDQDCESPREWDNIGVMVCFHRRYNLGDKHYLNSDNFSGWAAVQEHLERDYDAVVVLPLGLYDHSGISMYVGSGSACGDSGGWDSGQVGFIYATKAKVKEEYGDEPDAIEKAQKYLRCEVEVYDQFLRGDVYGYEITVPDDEDESCWDFYGLDYCISEAKEAAEYINASREENDKEALSYMAL